MSSAALQASFYVSTLRSASPCLYFVMVNQTAKTILMSSTVVRLVVEAYLLCHTKPQMTLLSYYLSSSGTFPTRGFPGLHNQTVYTGKPGFHVDNVTTGGPGIHTMSTQSGFPGVATAGVTEPTTFQEMRTTSSGVCDLLICTYFCDYQLRVQNL